MGCQQSTRQPPDTAVLDAVNIRFPVVKPEELCTLVRYAVAKEQQLRGRLPGPAKRQELLNILKIILKAHAEPNTLQILELCGEPFLGCLIDSICHASKHGKKASKGL